MNKASGTTGTVSKGPLHIVIRVPEREAREYRIDKNI